MATAKPRRSPEEIEDSILRKIFLISLAQPSQNEPKIVYLEMTAAEILSEGEPLLLSRGYMERVLIDRLSGEFPGAEEPFAYLVGCFRRAGEESRKVASMKDLSLRLEMESAIKQARKLLVSYCRIHIANPDMFGSQNPPAPELLGMIFSEVASPMDGFNSLGSGFSAPPGFLDELFGEGDAESLEPVMNEVYEKLRATVERVSALGNFQQPLRALQLLVSYPNCAKALVNHRSWIPKEAYYFFMGEGRVMELKSILGAFFHVSALPDYKDFRSTPDVGQQCFSDSSTHRPADLMSSFTTIKTVMNILYDGLREVILSLLKNVDTREEVLQFLAAVIMKNSARFGMQVDPLTCASTGMFVKLSAVMLQLCERFLDAIASKREKIIPKYVFFNNWLDMKQLTAIHATSDEASAWMENLNKIEDSKGENRALQSGGATTSGSNSGTYASANTRLNMYSRLNDDSSQLVCENSREVNIGESSIPLFIPVLEKYQLSDLESEGFHSKSEAESRNSCDGNSAADKVSKEQTTDVPCDSTISVHSCLRAAEDTSTVTSLVHFKRPYGDGNSDDIVRKRARQKDRDKKLVSSPGISSLIICLNETPASEETLATADLVDNAESLTDNSLSSPCLASNSGDGTPSRDRHIQFSSCHEYFGNDDRRLEIDPLEVLHSPLSDYLHCRLVPIGPSHQAVIPELRSRLALKNGALSFDLGVDVGSNDKWLGACAMAMPDLSSVVMECQNCCSLRECDCPDEGSMRCVRQHIMEARERLKLRLGNEKFFQLGFCEMGDVVSQKWTKDEETLFHKVVLLNPASLGRNFWPVLSRAFPSRSCKELVSYYFNVFILRKRAEQNRFDPLKADSDNDEWQESNYDEVAISDEEEVEEDQEDSVVESPVDVDDVGIRTCLSERGDMHDEVYDEDYDDEDKGFFGDSDGFRGIRLKVKNTSQTIDKHSSDVADDQDIQDDSCTSYEGQFNLCHSCHVHADDFGVHGKTDAINCITDDEYVKGCHDSKLWEINYVGAVEKDMELLPTCHVIEEVFGKETVVKDAGCTP